MWRWSWFKLASAKACSVFSTYVEVILKALKRLRDKNSILHVCGGDPSKWLNSWMITPYSPRMWRWSRSRPKINIRELVFSTYVEVIPSLTFFLVSNVCILHVCGGDPILSSFSLALLMYSPRMWRWSLQSVICVSYFLVFSTYVEVIPLLVN